MRGARREGPKGPTSKRLALTDRRHLLSLGLERVEHETGGHGRVAEQRVRGESELTETLALGTIGVRAR